MMYTLYMLAGPEGVMFGYVSYQLRSELCRGEDRRLAMPLEKIIAIIEWVPLRLLAITFSLVGDFNSCVSRLRRHLWEFNTTSDNAQLIADWARCALSEPAADDVQNADCDEAAMGAEIEALSGLLERKSNSVACRRCCTHIGRILTGRGLSAKYLVAAFITCLFLFLCSFTT